MKSKSVALCKSLIEDIIQAVILTIAGHIARIAKLESPLERPATDKTASDKFEKSCNEPGLRSCEVEATRADLSGHNLKSFNVHKSPIMTNIMDHSA